MSRLIGFLQDDLKEIEKSFEHIKKMIDNGIIESVSQSGQSVLSKGRYWNTHINLKGVNNA